MKKRKIKSLIITVSILLALSALVAIYSYFSISSSQNSGGIIDKSGVITFGCNSNYRNVFITLDIEGSNINSIVNYSIKNPSGKILEQGEISALHNKFTIDKKFQGQEGTWKIEFENIASGETISYNLDEQGTNYGFRHEQR